MSLPKYGTTVVLLFVLGINLSYSQNIAQWRGVNRDGIYNETNLLKEWPVGGPEMLWFTEKIGTGYSTPAILNDKIFINGEIDSISYLFAFDLNGKLLWKSPNGMEFFAPTSQGEYSPSNFPGARSTPTIVDNLVYACSGKGRIACYNLSDGAEIWAVEMVKDLGGYEIDYGYAESLVVDDKNLYCFPGGQTSNIVALDRFTGKTVWTSKALKDTTAYCSPIIVTLPERKILVNSSRHYMFAVDCRNGELLWSHLLDYKWDGEHCNTPVYADGCIYNIIADPDGKGAFKLELSPDGKSVKEIWYNKHVVNNYQGFVKLDNHIFTTLNGGNYLKSIELNNGTVVDSVRLRTGSIIFADNKFICYSLNGDVTLINYEQKKLEITGRLKIEKGTKEHITHPVVANGILYIRHGNTLMAYKII